MPDQLLRLTQYGDPGSYRVEISVEADQIRQTADVPLDFHLSPQKQENIRWYLEDFRRYSAPPTAQNAARVEAEMAATGTRLFAALFDGPRDARDLWPQVRDRLSETRVEVVTEVAEAATVPWELLRDPKSDYPVALGARAFVRAYHRAAQRPQRPAQSGPIRILLVICRPRGANDVAFRSVANRLLKALQNTPGLPCQVDVLRPPTFEQFSHVLHAARDSGEPYHVVHFDGHGAFGEYAAVAGARFDTHTFADQRPGPHGYLQFEAADPDVTHTLISGPTLGQLLVRTRVPVLVLNACRSAYCDTPAAPIKLAAGDDPHTQVRSFGSLAQEVMDAGVGGVVAMRYKVYVDTAACFMADLYAAIARGLPLGEAVGRGRMQLAAQPLRGATRAPLSVEDWMVPVVYEATPISLFPATPSPGLAAAVAGLAGGGRQRLTASLPPGPDAGFHGREETLLALDRRFDKQRVVLLHAYAGAGKSAAAVEFARWYALTGGVAAPVLYTSFQEHVTLGALLDQLAATFPAELKREDIRWAALSSTQRWSVAIDLLRQLPILWIWDGVEQVCGFPAGSPSRWTQQEQADLLRLLRAAPDTKARFLLTSRRAEEPWLGELPARVAPTPMLLEDSLELLRSLAEKRGQRIGTYEPWMPLLEFAEGNPAMTVELVSQALARRLKTQEEILQFKDSLLPATRREGLGPELPAMAASLRYGFGEAFSEKERKLLGLLHLFQRFVNVDALCEMADPDAEWHVREISGVTRDQIIRLMDRVADCGLLTQVSDGVYAIHPAMPAYMGPSFAHFYPASEGGTAPSPASKAIRAFVETMDSRGQWYEDLIHEGRREILALDLQVEEANFLNAYRMAISHGWYKPAKGHLQALNMLYQGRDHQSKFGALVKEFYAAVVDPQTGSPRPGWQSEWAMATMFMAEVFKRQRDWPGAERLFSALAKWAEKGCDPAVIDGTAALTEQQERSLLRLSTAYMCLGDVQLEQDLPTCTATYELALKPARRTGDWTVLARVLLQLGHAYRTITAIQDLRTAQRYYEESLKLCAPKDGYARALRLFGLGRVALKRAQAALKRPDHQREAREQANLAEALFAQAKVLTPAFAQDELAAIDRDLGALYTVMQSPEKALAHLFEAVEHTDRVGDISGAVRARSALAACLRSAGRDAEALAYVRKALEDLEGYPADQSLAPLLDDLKAMEYWLTMRLLVAKVRGTKD